MDNAKKAAFVRAMGRQKFSKGGMIRKLGKRKYFASGGDTTLGGANAGGTQDTSTDPNTGFLGSINNALGLNNQFNAQSANIQQGTNAAQLNNAYSGAQQGLTAQQNLMNSLNPQVGTGVTNQNLLANQLAGMSQGQGPNPAGAELAQTTAQNVAQTGSQMAGARGASGNVGLMARQIGQQGANTQQQAAGQEATLKAQQQIAAQQNLANLSNNQISQAGQATTGVNSAQQNEQSLLQNANTSANNAAVGMQSNMNNNNAQTSAANQNMASNTMGGITSALSSVSSLLAKGGVVKPHHVQLAEMNAVALHHGKRMKYDEGGDVEPDLGTFKAGDDSASSPDVASGSTLPADQTNLASAVNKPSSITGGGGSGGGGGGGMSSMMSMAAMMADGGPVPMAPLAANPLLGGQGINGPGSWVGQYMNSGSASAPNIAGSNGLPENKTNMSKVVKDAMDKQKKKKPDTESEGTATDDEMAGGPSDTMDNSAPMSPGAETPMDAPQTEYAAHGGDIHAHMDEYFGGGGKVPAMVSPGEIYLSPENVRRVKEEGIDPAKIGEKFKGKAKVKGDSLKNDTIPRTLEEGGVVIDRKNMSTREKRELFVHKATARKKAGG